MPFDAPPFETNMRSGTYTTLPTAYKDIHAGQIQYYLDTTTSTPFFTPFFSTRSSAIVASVDTDPMGGVQRAYQRDVLPEDIAHTLDDDDMNTSQILRDEVDHRESMLALRMRTMNRNDYRFANTFALDGCHLSS
jgi:hypothetical protein